MKATLFTLTTTLLLNILFSGCASREKPTLACFKGSSACISQIHTKKIEVCSTCHAII